jgi:enterochelin esterase-like enzyme
MTAQVRTAGLAFIVAMFPTLTGPVLAQTASEQASRPPAVTLAGTEVRTLTSTIAAQEYKLLVSLPPGYSDASKRFPVVYVLDAQWDFPLVEGLVATQLQEGYVPSALIVGITWGGASPDIAKLRTRDFTPPEGAATFLTFVKQELVPYVDATYRTTNDRTLMGHSAGGVVGAYALVREPDLFNRYVLASPDLSHNMPTDDSGPRKGSAQKVEVFLSAGGLETPKLPALNQFADALKKNHPEMHVTTKVIEGGAHNSSEADGYLAGLRNVYAPTSVVVSPQILDEYVGKYKFPVPGYVFEIGRDASGLVFIAPEGGRHPTVAQSDADFAVQGLTLTLHFKRDEAGHVTGFEAEDSSGRHFHERLK